MTIRTRIGLMVPSTNSTCEPDFYRVLPPTFTTHTARLWLTNDGLTPEGVERMNAEVEEAVKYLKTAEVDLIVYGCTTGSFFKGPGYDKELLGRIEAVAGVPAVATAPAAAEALRSIGARRVSIASPYPDWDNERLGAYYQAVGFDVLNVEGEPRAAKSGARGINDFGPETVVEFVSGMARPEADAVFCACTAWRSLEAVEELERRLGKPVITAIQATIWAALRRLGIQEPISGSGSLLSRAEPVSA